jgi:hypothetical protein
MAIRGIEQPVVFKMARGFNLQSDSGARERVKAVEFDGLSLQFRVGLLEGS